MFEQIIIEAWPHVSIEKWPYFWAKIDLNSLNKLFTFNLEYSRLSSWSLSITSPKTFSSPTARKPEKQKG